MALTQDEINEVMQQLQPIIAKALNESTSLAQAQDIIQQGVTQYVGARYVPLFADPIEWDNTRAYEPLTIVLYQGNSFTTRQYTPVGIDINNEAFWAKTGNYNAQVEQYRQEVLSFDGRINQNAAKIEQNAAKIDQNAAKIEQNAAKINSLENQIMVVYGDSWSDFSATESNWTNLVAKQLNCIRKNYSKSGATITDIGEHTIKTLAQEVAESVAELSSVAESVKYVYILMGVNDVTHDVQHSTILDELVRQTTIVRGAFPNALISFSFNFPCNNQSKYMPHVNNFKQFAFNRGYRYIDLGSLMFAPSLYKADKLHPNDAAGTGYIAGRMLGSQCNVKLDDYDIKNDSEGIVRIMYSQLGAILYVQFKGSTSKLTFGDFQFKLSGSTIGSSTSGPTILTADITKNYVTALNTNLPESSVIWKGLIYA